MCIVYLIAFLFSLTSEQCSSKLIEDSSQSFMERMHTGKTSFIYFGNHVNPTIKLFMEQLEMSADALQDYGISVVKVNCSEDAIANYCTGEKLMTKAYLFRGSEVLRSFDIDTVFDVNAIVSHVLFSVLFNEVRYVHTPAELLRVESAAKQNSDIVVGHIPVLGLPEHRALMEAAFVYGTKYQFVQTTGTLVLKHMGVVDPSSSQAWLWFLHCKGVSRRSDPCPSIPMRKPLNTINIHTFLQLMEAPLVTEAVLDPSDVDVVHMHLGVPVLYLFSQLQTQQLDWATAQTLALQLRGEVGVVVIHRDGPNVKTSLKYNAAYRLPQEDVKYFTLNSAEGVVKLFKEELLQEHKFEDEEEDEEHWSDLDILDDEVSESVYRDRDLMLDLESVIELTSDTFQITVTQNDITVVLFYFKWDAVCMAFIQSYIEVADALEGMNGVKLAAVNCGEWTDICSDHNVTSFPTVLIYRPMAAAQLYKGMLGTKSLHRFILLSLVSNPYLLSSSAEVMSFLEGDLYSKHMYLTPVRVLGLFSSTHDMGVTSFEEAARLLRGETILGLFAHKEAEQWVEGLSVNLPALLVSRSPGVPYEVYSLPSSSPTDLVSLIKQVELDRFPELTVENLPWYLELGKPLLLLFIGKEDSTESMKALAEIKQLLSSGQLDSFLPCWIHLGRTPVGRSILEKYLGFVPPLPVLVMSRLKTGEEVFLFPPERPLMAKNILQWIHDVENGQEQPAGLIPDGKWGPPVPFFDFLAIMDQEAPTYAAQRAPKMKTGGREDHREQKHGTPNQRQTPHPSPNPQAPRQHSEL
ncbi:thioredoxin domain-containing protein 16 isoform X1 [Sinocyclocheilus anshuiensis]|uniref:thioredoxin domain-containing protein 16 isoform X1 n=2 Tax=Sinocyclocheilus anshuiensis TaxID=1608454 RepID=UPI0007B9DA5B|nr:PREDICTED: thioredoxin domain-containing protein 16 isoform X1 [Sinocyclocheilus anshuiensis]